MPKRIFVLVCMWLCVCNILLAWGENLQSIEADFVQNIISEDGVPAHYEGRILAKVPSHVKWLYKSPLQKEIYMNGRDVIIYEPNLMQVSHSHLQEKSDFISIIQNSKKQDDGAYHVKVEGVEYIMFVDSKNLPDRIEYTDSMGAKTTLKLHNVKLNTRINDSIFSFTPPKDVEVVDLKTH